MASESFREFGRIYGVMDELDRLKNTVESIKAVLLDAEDKQKQSHAVKNWVRRLKDVLLPADDLIDEFLIEDMIHKRDKADKNKVTQVFHSLSLSRTAFRLKMAHKIEKIQKRFNDVVEDLFGLNLNSNVVVVEKTNDVRRETCGFLLRSSNIVGREKDKNKIISLLRQPHGNQNVSGVAIVGVGGIGKTTLAQLVYNDAEVKKIFEKRMWVCVHKNFNVRTFVRKMLESLINSKLDNKLSLDNLQNMLREILIGKRCLLVLDDVWDDNVEKWTQLWTNLKCDAQDSKILVTTRLRKVSEIMGVSSPYYLSGLTNEEAWSLLKNIIAYEDEAKGVNETFESVGKKITKMCDGLPLVIGILGGILQGKTEEKQWYHIIDDLSNLDHVKYGRITMRMLKLSYKNLSPQLQQCVAYCSLYPKDWQIEKDELIQLWMAQGYLELSGEHDFMENTGNQFVMTLLKKSIFQDAKMDDNGDVHSFKMPDLVHDFATCVADGDCCYLDSEGTSLVASPMHVSLEPNAVHLLDTLDKSRLRTLILLSSDEEEELNWDELFVISKFKYLRALKLSYPPLSKLSGSIGKLKHLRYLNLSCCRGLGSLFKSISNIFLLQTLIMTPNEKVEFSTMDISKLRNLRHLHISDWEALEDKNPAGFGKLSMQQFKGMGYSNQYSLPRQYEGMLFSNWLFALSNLVEISLFLCGRFRYLPSLERHPFLKSLHISYLEELECIYYEEASPSTFFPALESLTFWFCGKFKGWSSMLDDFNHPNSSCHLSLPPFPCLSQLSIIGCPLLTEMPTFPSLESRLELFDSSVETFEATLNMVASTCLNDSRPLSILKSLHIDGMGLDLKKIPKDWMRNFTSLRNLQISWFTCEIFQDISVCFKDSYDCLPSLQRLAFHNCEDLEALPDWICRLSLLTHLSMYDCINLASLPKRMYRLTNLQTLEIIGCPIVIEECETQTSEVLTKIAHIPEIILK